MGKAIDFVWSIIPADTRPLPYYSGIIWIVSWWGPGHWSADSKNALLGVFKGTDHTLEWSTPVLRLGSGSVGSHSGLQGHSGPRGLLWIPWKPWKNLLESLAFHMRATKLAKSWCHDECSHPGVNIPETCSILKPCLEKQSKLLVKGTVSGTGLLWLKVWLCCSCHGTLWPPVATSVKWG